MKKHEMIYVFYRKLPVYNIDSHISISKIIQKPNNSIVYGSKKECIINKYEPPLPDSILEFQAQIGKHSTQKPVELMKWILKYYSKEGDTVLDPTMGSGSTGVACSEMNRKFIGIEKDIEIFKVSLERNKVNFL